MVDAGSTVERSRRLYSHPIEFDRVRRWRSVRWDRQRIPFDISSDLVVFWQRVEVAWCSPSTLTGVTALSNVVRTLKCNSDCGAIDYLEGWNTTTISWPKVLSSRSFLHNPLQMRNSLPLTSIKEPCKQGWERIIRVDRANGSCANWPTQTRWKSGQNMEPTG